MFVSSPAKVHINEKHSKRELDFYYSGEEKCTPGYEWGPMVRDHFVLHVIFSGCGRFQVGDREQVLKAGDFFIIYPGVKTWYKADLDNPWHYCWVGFDGIQVSELFQTAGIDPKIPWGNGIFDMVEIEKCFKRFSDYDNTSLFENELNCISVLYRLFALLVAACPDNSSSYRSGDIRAEYISRVISLVERRYSDNSLGVNDMAVAASINRYYLARIFRRFLSTSPSGYLNAFRMRKAVELLTENKELSIKEIAYSVGYRDPLFFSRMFRRFYGIPATQYRKNFLNQTLP